MHILFASQTWPHPGHDQLSANQVIFELIRSFRQTLGHRVSVVCTYRHDRRAVADVEQEATASLEAIGVNVLPAIEIPDARIPNRLRFMMMPKLKDYFPELGYRNVANALVERMKVDAVIVPWSERATQLFAEANCLRVAYYGNPDPKNMRANMTPPIRPSRGWLRDQALAFQLREFEQQHLQEMRRYHLLGNVAANDAEYYHRAGVSGAFYCRMVYGDRAPADWPARRDELEAANPHRIIANIGSRAATGNILGLHYFADQVLPLLQEAISDSLDVVLLGGGRLPSDLAAKLARPGVRNIGFVEDIDEWMLGAPVFLCLNNASAYKVNQSRYLHAWSLGGCIVAHSDACLSLPEMRSRENALLGATPKKIVDCILEVLENRQLRRQLGANGRKIFLEKFNANAVASDLSSRITAIRNGDPALVLSASISA
jgi:hypothetical protein